LPAAPCAQLTERFVPAINTPSWFAPSASGLNIIIVGRLVIETFVVPDPRLTLDQIEAVQQEVVALLGWDRKKEKTVENEDAGTPVADAGVPPAQGRDLKDGFYSKDAT